MSSGEWFKTGFEAVDALPDLKKQNRFWLNVGEEKKVIFLDDAPFTFWEHNFTINGDFRNYATCLKNLNKPCPMCEAKIKIYYIGLFTVIDLSVWTDKSGKLHKNEVKLFAAKVKALKLLKKQKEKDRLKNGLFSVGRIEAKSGTSGDFFDFDEAVNPLIYVPDAKPMIYEEVCKPLEYDQLKVLAGFAEPDKFAKEAGGPPVSSFTPGSAGAAAAAAVTAEADQDEVPF
jgi:hypothetical protein